jgi:hypothetical protein
MHKIFYCIADTFNHNNQETDIKEIIFKYIDSANKMAAKRRKLISWKRNIEGIKISDVSD